MSLLTGKACFFTLLAKHKSSYKKLIVAICETFLHISALNVKNAAQHHLYCK
jgi:hypothetical protein